MKFPFVLSSLWCLGALSMTVSAQNLTEFTVQLDSDQMDQRTEARHGIQQLLTDATAPTVEVSARAALEQEVLQLLESGSSQPAQVWLLRMLELIGSAASVDPVAAFLTSSDVELRDCARRALAANPAPTATSVLVEAMRRADDAEKCAYIDGLAYRGDVRSAKDVAKLLTSRDPATVVCAANALTVLADRSVYPELKAAHASAPAASRAAIELAMLATGADVQTCLALIQAGANVGVAEAAFVALVRQDAETSAQVLQERLAEEPSPLRRAILGTAMSTPALQALLIDGLATRAAEDQLIILTGIVDQQIASAETAVIALLSSKDKAVGKQAIFTLGEIGTSASFEPLYALFLGESNNDAANALAKLDLPAVDDELFRTVTEATDLRQRAAAIQLLTLRNTEGAAALFTRTIAVGNPDDLRAKCLKALESIGTLESCQAMADLIISDDSVKRPAQKSLKRLCLNYGGADRLWESVFVPALQAAPSDAAREDLLVIADAVAGEKLLAFIRQQVAQADAAMRPAALKILQRWPDMEAGELWIEIATAPGASSSDIVAAQTGLSRIAKNRKVKGWEKLKLDMMVEALEKAPTPEFKKALVASYAEPSGYIQHYLHDAFESYLSDPVIGSDVQAILAAIPDSHQRRKR